MRAFSIYDSSNSTISTVIINKELSITASQTISLSLGISSKQSAPSTSSAIVTRLTGPSASAIAGVLLANQTYDTTSDGLIGGVASYETIPPNSDGSYTVVVDALSVVVLKTTIPTGSFVAVPSASVGQQGTSTNAGVNLLRNQNSAYYALMPLIIFTAFSMIC